MKHSTKKSIMLAAVRRICASDEMNKQEFKERVLKDPVPLGEDGSSYAMVVQLYPENFTDSGNYQAFWEQLESEGRLGAYCGIIQWQREPLVQALPIFGSSDRYVTKWFRSDADSAANDLIKTNRDSGVLERAQRYIDANGDKAAMLARAKRADNVVDFSEYYQAYSEVENFVDSQGNGIVIRDDFGGGGDGHHIEIAWPATSFVSADDAMAFAESLLEVSKRAKDFRYNGYRSISR